MNIETTGIKALVFHDLAQHKHEIDYTLTPRQQLMVAFDHSVAALIELRRVIAQMDAESDDLK